MERASRFGSSPRTVNVACSKPTSAAEKFTLFASNPLHGRPKRNDLIYGIGGPSREDSFKCLIKPGNGGASMSHTRSSAKLSEKYDRTYSQPNEISHPHAMQYSVCSGSMLVNGRNEFLHKSKADNNSSVFTSSTSSSGKTKRSTVTGGYSGRVSDGTTSYSSSVAMSPLVGLAAAQRSPSASSARRIGSMKGQPMRAGTYFWSNGDQNDKINLSRSSLEKEDRFLGPAVISSRRDEDLQQFSARVERSSAGGTREKKNDGRHRSLSPRNGALSPKSKVREPGSPPNLHSRHHYSSNSLPPVRANNNNNNNEVTSSSGLVSHRRRLSQNSHDRANAKSSAQMLPIQSFKVDPASQAPTSNRMLLPTTEPLTSPASPTAGDCTSRSTSPAVHSLSQCISTDNNQNFPASTLRVPRLTLPLNSKPYQFLWGAGSMGVSSVSSRTATATPTYRVRESCTSRFPLQGGYSAVFSFENSAMDPAALEVRFRQWLDLAKHGDHSDYSQRRSVANKLAALMVAAGIKLVAFDFDCTLTEEHLLNCKEQAVSQAAYALDGFLLGKELNANNIIVSIATYNDPAVYREGFSGSKLIRYFFDKVPSHYSFRYDSVVDILPSHYVGHKDRIIELANRFAWIDTSSSHDNIENILLSHLYERKLDSGFGKNVHLDLLSRHYGLDKHSVLLIDDSLANINDAMKSGYCAIGFKQARGFKFSNMRNKLQNFIQSTLSS